MIGANSIKVLDHELILKRPDIYTITGTANQHYKCKKCNLEFYHNVDIDVVIWLDRENCTSYSVEKFSPPNCVERMITSILK